MKWKPRRLSWFQWARPLYVWCAKRTPPLPVQLNPPCVSSKRPGFTCKFVGSAEEFHAIDEKDHHPIRRVSRFYGSRGIIVK